MGQLLDAQQRGRPACLAMGSNQPGKRATQSEGNDYRSTDGTPEPARQRPPSVALAFTQVLRWLEEIDPVQRIR